MQDTRTHMTAVDKVHGGYEWRCCCGAKSEKPFPRRERAVRAGNWHQATVDLFKEA